MTLDDKWMYNPSIFSDGLPWRLRLGFWRLVMLELESQSWSWSWSWRWSWRWPVIQWRSEIKQRLVEQMVIPWHHPPPSPLRVPCHWSTGILEVDGLEGQTLDSLWSPGVVLVELSYLAWSWYISLGYPSVLLIAISFSFDQEVEPSLNELTS